jgi:uncharacterized protein
MTLEEKIMVDLKEAMKAKNQPALRAIRAIKAAILLVKTDGSGKDLDNDGEIKMIQKMVKQRQESLDIFTKQGREDLAEIEKEEIQVIQKYLPEQMSEEKLKEVVREIIKSEGAAGMKDMGKVMGLATAKVAGQADGKALATIVKALLS